MVRIISKEKYIVAGIVTFLIFSLGVTLGFLLQNQRYQIVEQINLEQDVNYLSLQLQYLYLNALRSQDNCPVLSAALKNTIQDLSESLEEVIAFEEEKEIPTARQRIIQRRYIIDNLRYWLLAQESKQRCHLDIVPILYFYASDCESCPNQGTILTFFKNLFGEKVLVFPINLDLREEEPMVEIVLSQFKVSKYPTIVVDEQKFEGVVKKDQLQDIICASLQDAPQCS